MKTDNDKERKIKERKKFKRQHLKMSLLVILGRLAEQKDKGLKA